MEKKNLDWDNLGFEYIKTDYSYVCNYKDGAWQEGGLTKDHEISLNESAGILHYCQEVFEGLKAYSTKDGHIVCFRPDLNAKRMHDSAKRLVMPPFPEDKFVEAVKQVVEANAAWVPPYGGEGTLYVRPFMFASGSVLGVSPDKEYQFRIFVTPVGPYYSGGVKPVKICVPEYDRAAPHGTGAIKAGLNYAMSLYPSMSAHEGGFADNMFLDPQTHTYVEESGGANILFVKKDGTLVVPQSATDSILPSITRRSLVQIAQDTLGMNVEQRPVKFDEIHEFVECGMCGTAAVISPVGEVHKGNEVITFGDGLEKPGPVMTKLRETLIAMQDGVIEAPEGWIFKVC